MGKGAARAAQRNVSRYNGWIQDTEMRMDSNRFSERILKGQGHGWTQ